MKPAVRKRAYKAQFYMPQQKAHIFSLSLARLISNPSLLVYLELQTSAKHLYVVIMIQIVPSENEGFYMFVLLCTKYGTIVAKYFYNVLFSGYGYFWL